MRGLGGGKLLIWNSLPTSNNVPADVVLGQADFNGNAINRGNGAASGDSLARPIGIWSDGQSIAVADSGNNRVLIWNSIPAANGAPADLVVGQTDFTTSQAGATGAALTNPQGVYSNGLQLFVSDTFNNRVLVFDNLPTSNGPSADRVIGQNNFTNRAANDDNQDGTPDTNPTARTLSLPIGLNSIGNRLFVSDQLNNRVLIYQGN